MRKDQPLDTDTQTHLLEIARRAIEEYLTSGKTLELSHPARILAEKRGAFVTLKKKGALRGCIGYPLPVKPLGKAVIEMAIAAATKDYRFQRLELKELPLIKIEISVLSLPRKIENISEIKIGTHGIIVSQGPCKGLLLPQVPEEWNWDRETFLKHGSLKAGLAEDAWKKGAEIEIFSAQVFSE